VGIDPVVGLRLFRGTAPYERRDSKSGQDPVAIFVFELDVFSRMASLGRNTELDLLLVALEHVVAVVSVGATHIFGLLAVLLPLHDDLKPTVVLVACVPENVDDLCIRTDARSLLASCPAHMGSDREGLQKTGDDVVVDGGKRHFEKNV